MIYNLYSSAKIIRMIESRRMRCAGHVARMVVTRNAYGIYVEKPEGKRPLGRPRRTSVDSIKMDFREMGWYGLDRTGSGWGPVEGCCEHGDGPSGFFFKMLGISGVAAQLAASQERLSSVSK
jgi:hypothetical protein